MKPMFIELTDKTKNQLFMINLSLINAFNPLSTNNGTHLNVGSEGNFLTVKESYDEIKQLIKEYKNEI